MISIIIALAIVCGISITTMAAPLEILNGEASSITQSIDEKSSPEEDAPESENMGSLQESEEMVAIPQSSVNTNSPFFVGAGIALATFIGVAIFCKFKGNK